MRKLLSPLITINNVLFESNFNSKFFCIYSIYKNYQILSLQLSSVSRISQFLDLKNRILDTTGFVQKYHILRKIYFTSFDYNKFTNEIIDAELISP